MVESAVSTQLAVLEYDLTVGLSAMEGRGFYYPTDTAVAPNGRLYVPNRSVDGAARGVRVTVCDIDSEYYGTFGYFGHDPGEFVWASCIAADREGRLFISDEYTNPNRCTCANRCTYHRAIVKMDCTRRGGLLIHSPVRASAFIEADPRASNRTPSREPPRHRGRLRGLDPERKSRPRT